MRGGPAAYRVFQVDRDTAQCHPPALAGVHGARPQRGETVDEVGADGGPMVVDLYGHVGVYAGLAAVASSCPVPRDVAMSTAGHRPGASTKCVSRKPSRETHQPSPGHR
jgi:hypothetical protein